MKKQSISRSILKVLVYTLRLVVGLIDFNWLWIRHLKKSNIRAKVDRPASSIRVIHNRITVTGWAFDEISKDLVPVRAKVGNETVSSCMENKFSPVASPFL